MILIDISLEGEEDMMTIVASSNRCLEKVNPKGYETRGNQIHTLKQLGIEDNQSKQG